LNERGRLSRDLVDAPRVDERRHALEGVEPFEIEERVNPEQADQPSQNPRVATLLRGHRLQLLPGA
jgi:hypothetical protein